MKDTKKFDEIINKAKELESYFITVTTRDKNKEEGNLTHHTFRDEFENDDIIPSLDACVSSLKITPRPPIEVITPEVLRESRKPLKIAIITHFNRCPDSYSPGKAVKNQIKLLRNFGHEVVFFTQEGSTLDIGCEMRPLVPKFKREKNVINEEAKNKFIDVLREQLTDDFDLAITHDFYIDDCITYREAIKECGVNIKWLHWARSGVGRPINFKMPNTNYVYMNIADAGLFAQRIGVEDKLIRVVPNEKDPSLFFKWNPITTMISNKMRLWEKDIIQTYPMCTTRMDAKGINSVIKVFGKLKEKGKNVALIITNSNGRRRVSEIENKMKYAKECGLNEQDIVFTSTLSTEEHNTLNEVPNKVIAELMQISNLLIFPTAAEVSSNVQREAAMCKQLLVVNSDLPCLFDFFDENYMLSYPFTSSKSLHYHGKDDVSVEKLAKQIIGQLESNKSDKGFRHCWKTHNLESVYYNYLEPVLYE